MLISAYKGLITNKRIAYRALQSQQQKEIELPSNALLIETLKHKVADEIIYTCNEIISLIDKTLLPKAEKDEEKVFYKKFKADYCRYMAECSQGDKLDKAIECAKIAYKEAYELAEEALPTTDSLRLSLALNYSVFFYETLGKPTNACKLAKSAFDLAISQLESLNDDMYKESATLLQLLRDNITLWEKTDKD